MSTGSQLPRISQAESRAVYLKILKELVRRKLEDQSATQYQAVADARERAEQRSAGGPLPEKAYHCGKECPELFIPSDEERYLWHDTPRAPFKLTGRRIYFAGVFILSIVVMWVLYVLAGGL